jgi:hypothetical protein
MLDLVFGLAAFVGVPTFLMVAQHRNSSREWKLLAFEQEWSPQTGFRIQTEVANRIVTITRPRPFNLKKYEWAVKSAAQMTLQLELPRYLPSSMVRQLLQDKQEDDPMVELWRILFNELQEFEMELSVEDGPGTTGLCLTTRMHEDFRTLPTHVQTLGKVYKAIDSSLLQDLRQLAESEQWSLELGETCAATDTNGHPVIQISHSPYQATMRRPLPERAPAGLRIRAKDDSSRGSPTKHPILDQFVQIEADDPSQIQALVDNPAFSEAALELVQGMGGEISQSAAIVAQDALLLEPSKLWERLCPIVAAMALP